MLSIENMTDPNQIHSCCINVALYHPEDIYPFLKKKFAEQVLRPTRQVSRHICFLLASLFTPFATPARLEVNKVSILYFLC